MAAAAPPTPTAQSTAAASATSPTTTSVNGQSVSSAAPDAPWWNGWEQRTLPDEENVSALREIWGRTGGRLRKWKREQGWKPPPPLKNPADVARDETERQKLRRLYGAELQYKPAFGVLWREGFVSKVELPKNGLEGPVPPQLEGLGRCRVVCLFGNRLAGPLDGARLPASLVHLDLSHNKIDGPVPFELGRLRKLRTLRLQFNKLKGPLPDCFDGMEELRDVSMQRNRLDGPLPPSLGHCRELRTVALHENTNLSGPVPAALARCSKLAMVLLAETNVVVDSAPRDLLDRGCDVQISPPKD